MTIRLCVRDVGCGSIQHAIAESAGKALFCTEEDQRAAMHSSTDKLRRSRIEETERLSDGL